MVLHYGNSSWENVIIGVPQGSILKLIIFLLYVNDILSIISSTAKMFANNTKLYCPIRTIDDCHQPQSDLNNLAVWSSKWLLKFNKTKMCSPKYKALPPFFYSLNGCPLREVAHQKDLGVIVSNNLLPLALNISKQ